MSTTGKVLFGIAAVLLVIVGWASYQAYRIADAFAMPEPSTVRLTGDRGEVYFHCAGFVTSTNLWLSSDPTGERSSSDYWVGGGRWDGLARVIGDTLEVYAGWRFEEPESPSLRYALVYRGLDFETFRIQPAQLYQNPGQVGLTDISC